MYSINLHQLKSPKQLSKGLEINFWRTQLKLNKRTSDFKEIFVKNCWQLKKKSYCSNLDIKVTDNKTSWKTIMLPFTKRPLKCEKINLIENGKKFSNDTELYNIFNGFFFWY